MLRWGPGQIVVVYVPRACTKKNLESIPLMMLVLGLLALKAPFRAPEKSLWVPSRITPLFNSLLKYVPTGYVLKENTRNYRKMLFFGFFGFLAIRAVFETSW